MTVSNASAAWPSLFIAMRALGLRRVVACLLAGVIGLQALGVGIALGRGPSHTHAAPSGTAIVLLDGRRGGFDVDAAAPVTYAHGFGHHHDNAARHFHAADDASVVVSSADQRIDSAAGDNAHALDLVVAALMAVMTTASLWLARAALRHGPASHRAWQPSVGFLQRLDRPPQFI